MGLTDIFLLAVRWAHALAAVAWVGGSIFFLLVLRPALSKTEGREAGLAGELVGREFRGLVDTCVVVLVLTGVVLTFDRLTSPVIGVSYVVTLGLKVALAVGMFALAWARRVQPRRPERAEGQTQPRQANVPAAAAAAVAPGGMMGVRRIIRGLTGVNLIVILGVVVFLLSDLLRALYEAGLEG
jgi:uncharacterized membrane protein